MSFWWTTTTSKFWWWLYAYAKSHVPDEHMDAAWTIFVQERIAALGRARGEEFVTWVLSDLYNSADGQGRDYRQEGREIRYPR